MAESFDALFAMLEKVATLSDYLEGQDLLQTGAEAIRDDAKARMGTYQEGWPALADTTIAERTRLGYAPDDPLLRAGDLRDAIVVFTGDDGELRVGIPADDPQHTVGLVQEFGSLAQNVPPRPVVGPAADAQAEGIVETIAGHVATHLAP